MFSSCDVALSATNNFFRNKNFIVPIKNPKNSSLTCQKSYKVISEFHFFLEL